MDRLVLSLLITIVDIYILLLFVRMFVADSERYDAMFGMIFKATDPVISPLGTTLRTRRVDLAPLVVILALVLLKGMMLGSIPWALRSFVDRLFQVYVFIIIIISGVREYYTNPIASFGQRMVNPVRAVAVNFSRQVTTVNLLSVLVLVILHTIVTLILPSFRTDAMGDMGTNPLIVKTAFVHSLGLIVNLTGWFTLVIIVNALLSWVSPDPLNPFVQLMTLISAPIVDPVRRVIPPLGGMIDISPIIAIIALHFVNSIGHGILSLF
jgi:YggT family protein